MFQELGEKKSNLLLLDTVSFKHWLDLFIDGIVHLYPYWLSIWWFRQLLREGVELPNYNFICLSLLSILLVFVSCIWKLGSLVHIHIEFLRLPGEWALLSGPLSLIIFLTLKNTLSDINIATSTLCWLFSWYLF